MKHEYTDTQLQAAIDGAIKSHPFGTIVTREHDSNWLGEQIRRLDLIKSALAALPEPEPSLSKLRPLSEPAEADPYAKLKKAHAAGKVIQINCCTVEQPHWVDLPRPEYFGEPHEYRVKPEPKPAEAHSKTWTSHTPGDAMPCDGSKLVHTLWKCESPPKELLAKDNEADLASSWNWSKRDDDSDIIGWCYADEPTSEPLVTKPISLTSWTPAVGDVVTLKSGGPKMTIRAFDRDEPMEAWCHWFKDEKSCAEIFPTACLQPA